MNHKDMKQEILEQIRTGKVGMHSHVYFALRVALFLFCALLALIVSVILFNIISFHMRAIGDAELLGFGARGFGFFLQLFPWGLLFFDIVLIAIAVRLLQYFRFGYRNPAILLLAVLFGLTIGMGLALDRTVRFNEQFTGREGGPMNIMYHREPFEGPPGGAVCKCEIVAIDGTHVTVREVGSDATPLQLILPPHFATSTLSVGEVVFIAGDRDDDVIEVFGIKKMMPYPPVQESR